LAVIGCGGGSSGGDGTASPAPPGTLVINWTRPAVNADGSTPVDAAGYRVRYGTSPAQLTQVKVVQGAASTSAQIDGLASGTYYVSIETLNAAGTAGDPSNTASVTLP
jgi:hypothetical protein